MKYGSFPDITGKRFGKITVMNGKMPDRKVLIRCDCGIEKSVSRYDVYGGKIKSCGHTECIARTIDLRGQQFGLLIAIEEVGNDKLLKSRCAIWKCQCDCGNIFSIPSNQLISGRTKSCGCGKSKWISQKNSISIKERVENQVLSEYKRNAFKRGIEFLLSKESFIQLLYGSCHYCGIPPSNFMKKQKVTGDEIHHYNGVDRVNNEIGYALDNCVTCCKLCNHAKSNMTKEEFLSLALRIVNHSSLNI